MKTIFTTIFFSVFVFTSLSFGQSGCDEPTSDPNSPCFIYCNFVKGNSYNYYPGTIYSFPCGTAENNLWYSMIAEEEEISVYINSYNCLFGQGLQMLLYDQNLNPVSNCYSSNMVDFSGSITAPDLTVGEIYWLMIDGWSGDECNFELTITGNLLNNTGTVRDPKPIQTDAGNERVCKDALVCYTTDTITGADAYIWNFNLPVQIISGFGENEICVKYLETGFDTISLSVLKDCGESNEEFYNVEVIEAPITDIGIIELCNNQYPYVFNGKNFNSEGIFTEGINVGGNCDSVVTFELKTIDREVIIIEDTLCEGYDYVFRDSIFIQPGIAIYHTDYGPGPKCDSTFYIQLVGLKGSYTKSKVTICEGEGYNFDGRYLETDGTYIASYPLQNGCDSVIELNLVVEQPYFETIEKTVRPNTIYRGILILNDTTFTDSLKSKNGCDSTLFFVVDVSTSSSQNLISLSSISLHPNPASDFIELTWPEFFSQPMEIYAFDELGKVVKVLEPIAIKLIPNETIRIEIKDLPSGFYFLKIKFEGGEVVVKRFVKS